MRIFDTKIILASKSPRRKQLLEEAGFTFEIKTKEVDESFDSSMDVTAVAQHLAERKAMACADFLSNKNEVVLAADSTVVMGDKIYNKPIDSADAFRMLTELSGNMHTVYTGVCLLSKDKKQTFKGASRVWFEDLSTEEKHWYIDKFSPFDKAGSYGVQEWLGHCKIAKIEGTYANIMGLPVDLVYKNLLNFM